MTWTVEAQGCDQHILPLNDLVEHVASDDCICGPAVQLEDIGRMVVHHSLDGREAEEYNPEAPPASTLARLTIELDTTGDALVRVTAGDMMPAPGYEELAAIMDTLGAWWDEVSEDYAAGGGL